MYSKDIQNIDNLMPEDTNFDFVENLSEIIYRDSKRYDTLSEEEL